MICSNGQWGVQNKDWKGARLLHGLTAKSEAAMYAPANLLCLSDEQKVMFLIPTMSMWYGQPLAKPRAYVRHKEKGGGA